MNLITLCANDPPSDGCRGDFNHRQNQIFMSQFTLHCFLYSLLKVSRLNGLLGRRRMSPDFTARDRAMLAALARKHVPRGSPRPLQAMDTPE